MAHSAITISFDGVDVATAGILSQSLSNWIATADPSVLAERRRSDPTSMDFGADLSILFNAPAVVAIAAGIEAWLRAHHGTKITIRGKNGEIIAENVTARTAVELAKIHAAVD